MEKKPCSLVGFGIPFIKEFPGILEVGLLTPRNIRRNLPRRLANFHGNEYIEQIKSKFREPIDQFHHLCEILIRHAVTILMMSRELKTAGDLHRSFILRFTMFFSLYVVVTLERRLRKAVHYKNSDGVPVLPRWPHINDSKCFDCHHSCTLFAMLDFCSELAFCFGEWIFDVSHAKITIDDMEQKVVSLNFVDWLLEVSIFKEFFKGIGDLGFPEIVSADYNLNIELSRVIGNLHYEYEAVAVDQIEEGKKIRIEKADFKKSGSWSLLKDLLDDDLRKGIPIKKSKYGKHQPQTLKKILRKKATDKRSPRTQYAKIAESIKHVVNKVHTFKLDIPHQKIDYHHSG